MRAMLRYILVIWVFLALLLIYLANNNYINIEKDDRGHRLLRKWNYCMKEQMEDVHGQPNEVWQNFQNYVEACEHKIGNKLNIEEIMNTDEAKFHIMPVTRLHNSSVVTLGIGHDIKAEANLQSRLEGRVEFFGADPIEDINEELFSKIGLFFPFAVGGKSGMSQAQVLQGKTDGVATKNDYAAKNVVHINLSYFLKEIIGKTIYDAIWMDAENGEYDMFPKFFKRGELDNEGITVCQVNMEVHMADDEKKQKFHDFVFRMVQDKRYVFLRAFLGFHMRLYFVNMDDEDCLSRYMKEKNNSGEDQRYNSF